MADYQVDRWLRPRYVFAALALLIAASVLFSTPTDEDDGTPRLSTHSAEPYGAKGIYEVLRALGWTVQQRERAWTPPLDSNAVYLVLEPPEEPRDSEVGALLAAVRRGAAAVVVPTRGSALADSLGIQQSGLRARGLAVVNNRLTGVGGNDIAASVDTTAMYVFRTSDTRVMHYFLQATHADSDTSARMPDSLVTLASGRLRSRYHPVVVERRLGAGRVIALADPGFVRNSVVREGEGAVMVVRIAERLDPSRERPLVFDEYHHGFLGEGGMPAAVWHGLRDTAPGRVTLQLVLAFLVLLLAIGVRPVLPLPRARVERRSPFEHVGALARAYEQIGATRLATRRLVRGLRRRHPLGDSRSLSDEQYLARIAARTPTLAASTSTLRELLLHPRPASDLARAGAAIDTIERTIAT